MKNSLKVCGLLFIVLLAATISYARNGKKDNRYRNNYHRVIAGNYATFEIRNGTLWAYGFNGYGTIGDGTTIDKNTPVQIGNSSNWVSISAGAYHTLGIKADGTLWAWGQNGGGGLGIGTNSRNEYSPVQVGGGADWVKATAGTQCSFGIKADGSLWAWGDGYLGDSATTSSLSPVRIGNGNDWKDIAYGRAHAIGLMANGSLWAWGWNVAGQLGDSTTTNRQSPVRIGNSNDWVSIAVGDMHNLGIKADGSLWAWGWNVAGQLGDSTTTNRHTPVQIGNSNDWVSIAAGDMHSLAIKANGTLWAWGLNDFYQVGDGTNTNRLSPVQIGVGTDWVGIAAGGYNGHHNIAIEADGSLWAWGNNGAGQYGNGTNANSKIPIQVYEEAYGLLNVAPGDRHNIAIAANGNLWAWGFNAYGQIGDGTNTNKTNPVIIDSAQNWVDAAAGQYHSIGITADGKLMGWGRNNRGQLGDGTTTNKKKPVQIGNATDWVSVKTGDNHSLGLKADGSIWAWGWNITGQLGDGTTITRYAPLQIGNSNDWVCIAAGDMHSLGIKANGTLWAWGWNQNGQLGDGTTVNRLNPVQIGTGTNWVGIAAGREHSLGIKADGTTWAWGGNTNGQVGDNTTANRLSPVQVGMGNNWTNIAAGEKHSIGIKVDGSIWSWGWNQSGQLGDGTNSDNLTPAQVGSNNDWVSIACGHAHTLGIKANRQIFCGTGYNAYGQLGNGNTVNRNNFSCMAATPAITAQPQPLELCQGTKAVFFVEGYFSSGYQWQFSSNNGISWNNVNNNNTYNGAASDTLQIDSLLINIDGYRYRCIVSGPGKSDTSHVVTLEVIRQVNPAVDISVVYNGHSTYTFTAIPANGGNNPAYQWFKNSWAIPGATDSSYTTSGLTQTDMIHLEMVSSATCANPGLIPVSSRKVTTTIKGTYDNNRDVQVYPNPTTGVALITSSEIISQVELINLSGQTILTKVASSKIVEIDISTLSAGSYIIKVNGNSFKRIIKE